MRGFVLVFFALFCVIANAQVLPEGAYNIANEGQMYFSAPEISSVYISQQLFEVAADGVSVTWSTRMNVQGAGETLESLVTLAMIASAVTPSGNLIFSITDCLQNNLETKFPYAMCAFLYSLSGCTGVEFAYGQADLGLLYVNQTLIVINNMCGLIGSSSFICQSSGACSAPVGDASDSRSLPYGTYQLYGPGFLTFDAPTLAGVLLSNSNITVNDNSHSITLFVDVLMNAPLRDALYGGSLRFDGYVVNAGSGYVTSFTDCSQVSLSPLTPQFCGQFLASGIVQGQFAIPQINLTPQNNTANNTLLLFFGFAGLDGALQQRCIDGACGAPVTQSSSSSGITAGNCLSFDGTILNFDSTGDCLVQQLHVENLIVNNQTVLSQTIVNQEVVNQTVTEQTIVQQTVINQTVVNQTTVEQTVVQQTVINQIVTNQTITVQNINNQSVALQTVSNADVDQLTVNSMVVTDMRFSTSLRDFYNVGGTYIQTMGFISGYDLSGNVLTCLGASGSLAFAVTVSRIGTFVSASMTLVNYMGGPIVSGSCDYFGMISGTPLPIDFLPVAISGMGPYCFPFIQDQNPSPPCACSIYPVVNKWGSVYFGALASAIDGCCTGGNSKGFDNGGNYLIQNNNYYSGPGGIDSYAFSYNVDFP